jgi:hypothetical protein
LASGTIASAKMKNKTSGDQHKKCAMQAYNLLYKKTELVVKVGVNLTAAFVTFFL